MKIKPRHIQRFEAFIQNSKDPNAEKADDTKDNKKSKPVDPDDDTEDEGEDDDPVEEMKRYFSRQQKINQSWKSTI